MTPVRYDRCSKGDGQDRVNFIFFVLFYTLSVLAKLLQLQDYLKGQCHEIFYFRLFYE
jgi:hypothetical protein